MTISELGSVGEVIGAVATVATLLYLALQIRANTKQTKLTNWGVLAERYMSVYAQSSNFELADVIVRGRIDFNSLNEAEKLAFGHYMENICIANEGALVMADSFTRRDEGMVNDKTDDKIIEFLRNDARESFVEIGKKLKLSESAVRRRVKNLVDAGIIERFTVEMGEANTTSAIVLISVDSSTDTSKVSSKLTKLKAVKTVYEITGQYDISVIIRASNITEINVCIDELRKIQGVIDTNTVIILRTIR